MGHTRHIGQILSCSLSGSLCALCYSLSYKGIFGAQRTHKGLCVTITLLTLISLNCFSQANNFISKVWVADNGDGTYRNPVINADYSDPDAIRVGDDYYMISSSFNHTPGLPILHSKDLVNWELIGHALKRLIPEENFSAPQQGGGVWAPSIRYHNNEFYIYYPDPDFGIYLTRAKNILGPWSEPQLVEAGKGLIDPCPLWDDNGKVYLVHAFAGSRAGIKSILVVKELNREGDKVIGDAVLIYDGHEKDPTVEGPKFYKRNGWFYIFAPAGGVTTGWQIVLRSKTIYGPYERKIVMNEGRSGINGPHQGAWIITQKGEDWFLHFQDKGAYGRVVHLQPMKWINDWPVIGEDKDGDGIGEPVSEHTKPVVGKRFPIQTPPDSDEFNATEFGKQWQWQANPQSSWAFLTGTALRLYSVQVDSSKNLWTAPNILLQKFPAEEFAATTKLSFHPRVESESAGLVVFGTDYASVCLRKGSADSVELSFYLVKDADKGNEGSRTIVEQIKSGDIYLRVEVRSGAFCQFSYSVDGKEFKSIPPTFIAKPGRWVGAKLGLYFSRDEKTNDAGYADFDWFRLGTIKK
jgi:beta-xylosidase